MEHKLKLQTFRTIQALARDQQALSPEQRLKSIEILMDTILDDEENRRATWDGWLDAYTWHPATDSHERINKHGQE